MEDLSTLSGQDESSALIQRIVTIFRDQQNSYGFTVSGDNPVFVQSVREGGPAYNAGIQRGDRIVKVNKKLVTHAHHQDVVQMIKVIHFHMDLPKRLNIVHMISPGVESVTLTLFGKPSANPIVDLGLVRPQPPSVPQFDCKDDSIPEQIAKLESMLVNDERYLTEMQREYDKTQSRDLRPLLHDLLGRKTALEKRLKSLRASLNQEKTTTETQADATSTEKRVSSEDVSSTTTKLKTEEASPNSNHVAHQISEPTVNPSRLTPPDSPKVPPAYGTANGTGKQTYLNIITAEDDEFDTDSDEPVEDIGPFCDFNVLRTKPAHIAVFLHYLISNSDPNSLLFYLVSEVYENKSGHYKDVKKWISEICTAFLTPTAPLQIPIKDGIAQSIDDTLKNKNISDEGLRTIFSPARQIATDHIKEQLLDFRQKRTLGLGSLFGDSELKNDMNRDTELKITENTLINPLESILKEIDSTPQISQREQDRNMAIASSIVTFMKFVGVRASSPSSPLEKCHMFAQKESKFKIKTLPKLSKKIQVKGHQLCLTAFANTTFCANCKTVIWGISSNGYQCQLCHCNFHKGPCLESLIIACEGPRTKRKFDHSRAPNIGKRASREDHYGIPEIGKNLAEGRKLDLLAENSVGGNNIIIEDEEYTGENDDTTEGLSVDTLHTNNSGNLAAPVNTHSRFGTISEGMEARDLASLSFREDSDWSMSSVDVLSEKSEILEYVEVSSDDDNESDLDVKAETPSWQDTVNRSTIAKLSQNKKEVKRQAVINELIHTEKVHVRNLKVLKRVYYKPMLRSRLFTSGFISLMFPNLIELLDLHKSLLRKMKERRAKSEIVEFIGDVMLDSFDKSPGDTMKEACAKFCSNQSTALEKLKVMQRKDQNILSFVSECENHPLCRRLRLQDLISTGYRRLTKYPLLLEQVAKYTAGDKPDYKNVLKAIECTKETLAFVNQSIKDTEQAQKLLDIHKKLDRRSLDHSNNPAIAEFKGFDLTHHTLLHDGNLTWKITSKKPIELKVLLLEEYLVLLQKQDEKYCLKCENVQSGQNRDDSRTFPPRESTRSPIIKLGNVIARGNAAEKTGFFLVNTSPVGPQIYELIAATKNDRNIWLEQISKTKTEMEARRGRSRRPGLLATRTSLTTELEKNEDDSSPISETKPDIKSEFSINSTDDVKKSTNSDDENLSLSGDEATEPEQNAKLSEISDKEINLSVTDTNSLTDSINNSTVTTDDHISNKDNFTNVQIIEKIKEKDRQITALMRDRSKLLNELKGLSPAIPTVTDNDIPVECNKTNIWKSIAVRDLVIDAKSNAGQLRSLTSELIRLNIDNLNSDGAYSKKFLEDRQSSLQENVISISSAIDNKLTRLLEIVQTPSTIVEREDEPCNDVKRSNSGGHVSELRKQFESQRSPVLHNSSKADIPFLQQRARLNKQDRSDHVNSNETFTMPIATDRQTPDVENNDNFTIGSPDSEGVFTI
ncbi:Rho guanine nucleotide exchange factor 11 [Trichoplax sp. H2]|nr:Rho guanine nucleotide exchange factor 11 [Trichoplax sp. H2]|eukprot:RDD41356.1 Rho guanine nucleotide exchange factor 11 [Trichoplax sp. H2]